MSHSGAVESLAWDPVHRRLASAAGGRPHLWTLTQDSEFPTRQLLYDVDFLVRKPCDHHHLAD